MGRERIVATAPIDDIAIQILQRIAPVETSPSPDEQALLDYCENTIGFVSRGNGAVTSTMIKASKQLKVIGRPGAGYDTVDVGEATKRKIPVVYAPVGGFAVAEGALAMLMTLAKRIPLWDKAVKSGNWNERYQMKSGDMTERTLGIIGFGRIGAELARLVEPFRMTVLAYDPYVSKDDARTLGVELIDDLNVLLGRSDYISLHLSSSEQTRGLINAERVAAMKKGAILVNTARGDIIESLDILADALDSGQLLMVGLDVFSPEPPDLSHRIFQNPRLVCAPHMLGVSEIAMERIFRIMATGMVDVLEGRRPEFCVNPEVLD